MTFLPIVARELRVAARKRTTYFGRVMAATVPIVVAGFWLPVFGGQFSANDGKLLFGGLSSLAFAYCLLAGARLTADCLSAEKREGTLGLLFLTDLRGYDVVFGKLVACSLPAFYGLLATIPVMALALLFGGVTLEEVARTGLLLVNTLFFSLAAGVFVSTLSRNDRQAMFATLCVIALVAAAPYALGFGYSMTPWARAHGPADWLDRDEVFRISPAFAFGILRANSVSKLMTHSFYESLLATQVVSWALLVVASLIVPRACRVRPPGRWGARWELFRNRWSYGKPAQRQAFRARLLDQNAFYWLAARDRIKAQYVWLFVGALALLWCWAGYLMDSFIFDWDVSLCLLLLLFAFFKVWLTSEVCLRLAEDRASGAFELLLSSPLSLKDLAHGQSLALRRQFGRPLVALLILTYLLLLAGLRSPHSGTTNGEVKLVFWTLMITLAADLVTLKWVGMWLAITSSQVNRAAVAACARVIFLPTVVFVVIYGLFVLVTRVSGAFNNDGELARACTLWLSISLLNDLFFGLRARWRFLHQFRDVATQRFTPSGPGLEPFVDVVRRIHQRLRPDQHAEAVAIPVRRRWKLVLLAGPALALVLALGALTVRRQALTRQVEARLAAIRASGQPVTLAALKAWGAAVPENGNAATFIDKAVPHLIAPADVRRRNPRLAKATPLLAHKMEWPGAVAPVSLEFTQAVAALLASNQTALDLLQQASSVTNSRYPIDWRPSMPQSNAPWQAFGRLQPAGEVLQLEALLAAEQGDGRQATQSIQMLLALARAMAPEPYMSAQDQRRGFLHSAVRALERTLSHKALSESEMRSLSSQFHDAELATGQALWRGLIGERCLQIDAFRNPFRGFWGGPASALEKFAETVARRTGDLLGTPERFLLQYLDNTEDCVRRARYVGVDDTKAWLLHPPDAQASVTESNVRTRFASLQASWEEALVEQLETVARLRLAQAALSVEVARLGSAPTQPQPSWFTPLPADPFVSATLRYKLLDHGYLLYSVGRDGHDNGGLEPPTNARAQSVMKHDLPFRVGR